MHAYLEGDVVVLGVDLSLLRGHALGVLGLQEMDADAVVEQPCAVEVEGARAADGDEPEDVAVEAHGALERPAHDRDVVERRQREAAAPHPLDGLRVHHLACSKELTHYSTLLRGRSSSALRSPRRRRPGNVCQAVSCLARRR